MRCYQLVGALAVAITFAALGPTAGGDDGDGSKPTSAEMDAGAIEAACAVAAAVEPSFVRGKGKTTKMWCAVVDREGQTLAINATDTGGTPEHPAGSDAWRGSIEIAAAKAYSAVAFSSNDQALNTLSLGLLSRPDGGGVPGMVGHDEGAAPLWGIGNSNPYRPLNGSSLGHDDSVSRFHHGIITFAGGEPVYTKGAGGCSGGILIGAVGVSGDGVDEDADVAKAAVTNAGYCLTP